MLSLQQPDGGDRSCNAIESIDEDHDVVEHPERSDTCSPYRRIEHARRQLFVQVAPVAPMNRQRRRKHSCLVAASRVGRIKRVANELLSRDRRKVSPW